MSTPLHHTWTDEIDGRTFSVCETDHVTPCQREILNLCRQRDALADALIERMDQTLPHYWRVWDGELNDENDPGGHYRRIFDALRAAGRMP